jgi:hypothetical protein
MRFLAMAATSLCCLAAVPASAASGDPYKPAAPDSPLGRKLLATPVPANPGEIAYVAEAMAMLAQKEAAILQSYLERAALLAVLNEPAPSAGTVAEAIALEPRLPQIDKVRDRVFSSIIIAELAKPTDLVPEGVRENRSRYVQETPVVWRPKEQNAEAVFYYVHVVLRNASRADIAGMRGELVVAHDPKVTVRCELIPHGSSPHPMLRAGQSLPMFCATDWQKKTSLQSLIAAARAAEAAPGAMRYRVQHLALHRSDIDLQSSGGGSFYRRRLPSPGYFDAAKHHAASIVNESSCLDRGSCKGEFLGGFGELRGYAWLAVAAGVLIYLAAALVARRPSLRARTMWIITAVAALLPILAFALALGDKRFGLAALFVPVLGAHLWAAFAAGFWGAWFLALPFRRRAAPQSLGR